MNVKDFIYLLELGKSKSIIKAANNLYISQPALSQYLKKLELEAGTLLFQRVGKDLVPTWAGERCLKTAQEIIFLNNQMEIMLSDIVQHQNGHFTIGLSVSRIPFFMNCVLPKFYAKYPNISVTVLEGNTRVLYQHLLNGECIFIFTNISEQHENIKEIVIRKEESVLVAPNKFHYDKKSFKESGYMFPCLNSDIWVSNPFLMPSGGLAKQIIINYCKAKSISLRSRLTLDSVFQLYILCNKGIGQTIGPSLPLTSQELGANKNIKYYSLITENGPICRNVGIMYRKDSYISHEEKFLIELIKKNYIV